MFDEFDIIRILTRRLNESGIAFMLTGSMALNYYTTPRMTRDIDIVVELHHEFVDDFIRIFQDDFYLFPESIIESIDSKQLFNILHNESVIKIDCIIRKDDEYRSLEFQRRKLEMFRDMQT